jgi:hypothetical protein
MRGWCDVCRGDAQGASDLFKCRCCPRRFHIECVGLRALPTAGYTCAQCEADGEEPADERAARAAASKALGAQAAAVKRAHADLKARSVAFYKRERVALAPFVPKAQLAALREGKAPWFEAITVGSTEPFLAATLRDYQVRDPAARPRPLPRATRTPSAPALFSDARQTPSARAAVPAASPPRRARPALGASRPCAHRWPV